MESREYFCTEKTKENETDLAHPLPFTILLEYKLLNDENYMKGVGIEISGDDICFSHACKEWHGSQKLTIHKEVYWSGNNIVTSK